VPAIGARAGGIPELITPEQTGLPVDIGDVEGLAAAPGTLRCE
jgi:glycosyltransferase involved in cell wall biosynthesis